MTRLLPQLHPAAFERIGCAHTSALGSLNEVVSLTPSISSTEVSIDLASSSTTCCTKCSSADGPAVTPTVFCVPLPIRVNGVGIRNQAA